MKPLLTLLTTAFLGLAVCACGGASNLATSNATRVGSNSTTTYRNDRDNDGDNNDDDEQILDFGHTADAADNRAITALVTRYYAAAAAEDGTGACSLLTPFIAESVVEDYRHTSLNGKSCPAVMSKLFKRQHREILSKNATLKVMRVGIEGNSSLVVLDFPTIPEVREITVRRSANTWTILSLLDGILE
ncbi:MAG: hypothetical protein WA484_13295 [Solirubrobacteraceae bacterium]